MFCQSARYGTQLDKTCAQGLSRTQDKLTQLQAETVLVNWECKAKGSANAITNA